MVWDSTEGRSPPMEKASWDMVMPAPFTSGIGKGYLFTKYFNRTNLHSLGSVGARDILCALMPRLKYFFVTYKV